MMRDIEAGSARYLEEKQKEKLRTLRSAERHLGKSKCTAPKEMPEYARSSMFVVVTPSCIEWSLGAKDVKMR